MIEVIFKSKNNKKTLSQLKCQDFLLFLTFPKQNITFKEVMSGKYGLKLKSQYLSYHLQ